MNTRAVSQIAPLASLESPRLQTHAEEKEKKVSMLSTVFVILLVLWLLGVVTSYTMGGFIHILLVLAVITLIIRLLQGRRIVS